MLRANFERAKDFGIATEEDEWYINYIYHLLQENNVI